MFTQGDQKKPLQTLRRIPSSKLRKKFGTHMFPNTDQFHGQQVYTIAIFIFSLYCRLT